MFAKLAHLRRFGRTHETKFATWPANDNQRSSRQPTKSILVCHWHRTPSGALECVWSVEDEDAGGAAAPSLRPPSLRPPRHPCRLNGTPLLAA